MKEWTALMGSLIGSLIVHQKCANNMEGKHEGRDTTMASDPFKSLFPATAYKLMFKEAPTMFPHELLLR